MGITLPKKTLKMCRLKMHIEIIFGYSTTQKLHFFSKSISLIFLYFAKGRHGLMCSSSCSYQYQNNVEHRSFSFSVFLFFSIILVLFFTAITYSKSFKRILYIVMSDASDLHGLGSSVSLFYQARYRLHIQSEHSKV